MPDEDFVIPDQLGKLLAARQQTVAVAESVTGGHMQVAFTLAEKAMDFFQGGITVYNIGQKTRHLMVDPIHALASNAVSEQVAAQMAKNVCGLFLSDWGIAITGYASPVPEKNIRDLFACYAIYFRGTEMAKKTVFVENYSPSVVRKSYADHVINHFLKILTK